MLLIRSSQEWMGNCTLQASKAGLASIKLLRDLPPWVFSAVRSLMEKDLCIFNPSRVSALTGSSAVDPPPCRWPLTLLIVSPLLIASPSHNGCFSGSGSCIDWILSQPHPSLFSLVASGYLVLTVKFRNPVLLWVWVYLGKEWPICPSPLIKI